MTTIHLSSTTSAKLYYLSMNTQNWSNLNIYLPGEVVQKDKIACCENKLNKKKNYWTCPSITIIGFYQSNFLIIKTFSWHAKYKKSLQNFSLFDAHVHFQKSKLKWIPKVGLDGIKIWIPQHSSKPFNTISHNYHSFQTKMFLPILIQGPQ